jgi:hypothetical protein
MIPLTSPLYTNQSDLISQLMQSVNENQFSFQADLADRGESTLHLVPKSFAFVVGEQLIRPFIEKGARQVNRLIELSGGILTTVDKVVHCLIPSFPLVAAREPSEQLKTIENPGEQDFPLKESKEHPVWDALNIDMIKDYGRYIAKLSEKQLDEVNRNEELQNNYLELNAIVDEMELFIRNLAFSHYKQFEATCKTHQVQFYILKNMNSDLQSKGAASKFTPLPEREKAVVLTLSTLFQLGAFTETIDEQHRSSLPITPTVEQLVLIDDVCGNDRLEKGLRQLVTRYTLLARSLVALKDPVSFDFFKKQISNDNIEELRSLINNIKVMVESGLRNLVIREISLEEIRNAIINEVSKLWTEQKDIIDKLNESKSRPFTYSTATDSSGKINMWNISTPEGGLIYQFKIGAQIKIGAQTALQKAPKESGSSLGSAIPWVIGIFVVIALIAAAAEKK